MYNQDIKKPQNMQPSEALMQMLSSSWISQAICVAAQLGIADLLKNGSKSSDDLAKATGTNTQSLYRLLRALSSVGIFAEVENASFELTPLASYLQTNVPGSVHPLAIMFGKEWYSQSWLNLFHSLKTGNTAFKYVNGMELFEYLEKNPEAARIFNDAMGSIAGALQVDTDITTIEYDFSSIRKIVEVGGGHGSLITAILKRYPTMQGILFDLPPVVMGAKNIIDAEGLTERCQIVGGNFFESLPHGGNIYILKHVIHDWDDTHAIAILNNCRRAMPENGKLLLIEAVIPSKNKPSFAKFIDLEMLVLSGGCERTEIEYQKIFEAAGFHLTKVIPTKSSESVIEGIPI
jgi:O-methyltransferase domain/Dimerisation domain